MKPYFQDDWVTLWHGDCREIAPTLGRFDLCLTDPPFGLGTKLSGGTWGKKFLGAHEDWDAKAPCLDFLIHVCDHAVIWGGNYFKLPVSRGWLAWIKRDAVPTMSNLELAWTSEDRNSRFIDQTIAATNAERVDHPTQKPLAVMLWCLSLFPESKTVIDPYAGSGTTGRACKDLGLRCTMIEREERYCEIAARRMQQAVLPFTPPPATLPVQTEL